jgi:hypothetical protein
VLILLTKQRYTRKLVTNTPATLCGKKYIASEGSFKSHDKKYPKIKGREKLVVAW